jgi:hypothetical protein
VPLTPETANLIDGHALDQFPGQAIVINTARGGVIDEYALADRPAAGTPFASALDTSSGEPLDERSRLRQLSKSIITPHVGAPRPSRSSRPRWRPRAPSPATSATRPDTGRIASIRPPSRTANHTDAATSTQSADSGSSIKGAPGSTG